jgi:eukaryotic-like serine/threonine-protein kinase
VDTLAPRFHSANASSIIYYGREQRKDEGILFCIDKNLVACILVNKQRDQCVSLAQRNTLNQSSLVELRYGGLERREIILSATPRRLGKYELQVLLGQGGMAEVWKAFDSQLQRYVAIKLLHANLQADPDFITRFTREAQIIAALRHPNIVQIYDFHISEGGEAGASESDAIAYMVMEYIKGSTLASYIYNTSHKKHFPPAPEIIRLFTPISLAIDYAHQQGMIHRDIKPANILLDQRYTARNPMGEPILSDFGLAKLLSTASQTLAGVLLGTPLYISPEQVQNRSVSKQTDLYALGVVLYEVFTGVPPFRGDSLTAIMMQHLTDRPTEPHLVNPNLPPALSEVLLKGLAKDPLARFPSASAMTAAVAEAFNIPIPEDLKQGLSSTEDTNLSADQAPLSEPSAGMTPSSPSEAVIGSSPASTDVSVVVPPDAETITSGHYTLPTLPPMKAEATGDTISLPDSEVQLSAQAEKAVDLARQGAAPVNQETIVSAETPSSKADAPVPAHLPNATPAPPSETTPPVISPPAPALQKHRRLVIALAVLLICVLVGSGLGAFFLLTHHGTATPPSAAANPVVGQAFFISSGQVDLTTNHGSNDEFQMNLQHIPDPQAGNSYYAWLLPDKSQAEAAPILLGKVPVNHGVIHFFYPGDGQHSNLLATTSRFLITEESANITPSVPSPDLKAWRYYAELPQTPAPGQTYSLLDHLRHLLAIDPTLEALHLHGGLGIWTYRNTQSLLQWAGSARDAWSTKNFTLIHRQVVSILDALDGEKLVQQDVPAGTPILAGSQIAQVGLLQLKANQEPPGYLYHIALHLNGVLSSPGAMQYQRNLATQINTGVNNVNGWLEQLHQDAVQLVHMSDGQLALPSSLEKLNDMVAQANNAYMGRNDPSTGQQQIGVSQIYRDIQLLATFDVKPYQG